MNSDDPEHKAASPYGRLFTADGAWIPRSQREPHWLNADPGEKDDEDEPETEPQSIRLTKHPLAQKFHITSIYPVLTLLSLCAGFSIWVWGRFPGAQLWEASAAEVYQQGQYWRLLTTLFVHGDIAHLLANSGLFLVFGMFLRQYFGSWAFPWISLCGGVLTSALSLLTYEPAVHLIGASGMVYFMAAFWLYLFWRYADYLSVLQRSMRSLAFILVVLLPSQIEASVSYRTHAIGFALGILLAWMSSPWLRPLQAAGRVDRPAVAAQDGPNYLH